MNQNDIVYFIAQGLTLSGLLVVSISGLKTSSKEIIKNVYQNKNTLKIEKINDEPCIWRGDIRTERIESEIKEKVKFVFGFIFSIIGILMEVIFNEDTPIICLYRISGTIISTIIFTFICLFFLKVYVKYKRNKTVKEIEKGFKVDLEGGDDFIEITK